MQESSSVSRHTTAELSAIDLDEAGKRDIYKVNLLEAMLMAKEAWDAVSSSTIKHCWDHTKIQSDDDPTPNPPAALT